MKKFSWFLMLAIVGFACQDQNDLTLPEGASGRSAAQPGFNYGITSSSTDGYTWTIVIDQSTSHAISHIIFSQVTACDGSSLSVGNITAASVNGIDWMSKVVLGTGKGEACYDPNNNNIIKLDNFTFQGGIVTVVVTFDSEVTSAAFLINSAKNCLGAGDPNYSLSHVCVPDEPCEGQNETGWATGSRYVSRGNWATYTSYQAGTVNIYAGQNIFAGTATMSAVSGGMVTITIALNSNASFQSVSEPVKIQGYSVAPSGNPSPGRFANKGTSTTVTLPAANFYGIHLDLVVCPQ